MAMANALPESFLFLYGYEFKRLPAKRHPGAGCSADRQEMGAPVQLIRAANRPAPGPEPRPRNPAACLHNHLDELLTCFHHMFEPSAAPFGTSNAVERRLRKVRWRTRPMDTLQEKTGMDRILFAVFAHEIKSQGVSIILLLTQNN
jgi:hypothetical protein